MKKILFLAVLALLLGCDSGGDDSEEAQTSNATSADTQTTNTEAQCYYVPDPAGEVYVNIGEVGQAIPEEVAQEALEKQKKVFIATCYGDIIYTVTTTSTTNPAPES